MDELRADGSDHDFREGGRPMSRLLLAVAIEDAAVGPQGAKEAVAMALEPLGGVQVLRVAMYEQEQMRMEGGTFDPPKPKPAPTTRGGQVPARSSPQPMAPMKNCFSCGCYRSGQGRDYSGNSYWGTCGRTGQPVYEIGKGCPAWVRLGG